MNISLVLCPFWGRKSPPFTLALLSACLRAKGHKVFCFDLNNFLYTHCKNKYKQVWLNESYLVWESPAFINEFITENNKYFELVADKILKTNSVIVGFSIYQSTILASLELSRRIKIKDKNIVVLYGGPQCSKWKALNSIIKEPSVDHVVVGEGDITLPEFAEKLENNRKVEFCKGMILKTNGKIIDCGDRPIIKHLNRLPFPDFRDFSFELYASPKRLDIFPSRGCINHCVFCSENYLGGRYRSMNGARIYKEIEHHLRKVHKIDLISFNNSLINGDIKVLDDLCDLIIKNRLMIRHHFAWIGQAIIRKEMTFKLLSKMKLAGCINITYGVESGSNHVLKQMGKNFDIKTAEKVIVATSEAGIKVNLNFIIGFPGETEEDFEETISFIKRIRKYINLVAPAQSFCTIEQNTPLFNNSYKFHILPNPHNLFWETIDGKNNYLERLLRYEKFYRLSCDLGLPGLFQPKQVLSSLTLDYYKYKKNCVINK